ncbi:MAG TPA: gliding motility-associated C-terminal domain-containing protein, partial [Cytophagaceae bacterium]
FTYTYSKPGTYSVSLSTFDASGNPKDVYRNTVNVTACNEPVVASPVRYCKGAPPQPLTAILNSSARPATGLKWYTSAANGTGVTEITPSTATPGTNSYYVSQVYSTGAESDRAKIDVIVADAPAKPQIVGENPFVFCQTTSSSIEDLTNKVLWEAGATPRWYTTATGGTSTINPTIPSPGETNVKIYISAEKGTCESERAELVITKVSRGTDFLVEAKKPLSCGVDGEIIFIGLAPSQVYNVSYNALPEAEKTSTSNGRVILSLPAGTYKNFKVSQDGCVSVMNAPRTIENFGDGSAVGGVTRADTNVLAIGGKTIVRIRDHSGAIKWHVSKDGALFSEIPGAIKDTVGTGFLQAGTYSYKALLTSGSCNTPVSSTISVIKVGQPVNPVAGTITTSTPSVCAGSMAMLSLQGNTGDVQWQNSPEGTKFTNIEAATTATFTSPQLETSTWYRVKVTTTIGSVYSNKLEIKVNPSVLNGMSSSASNFSVSANQPKECGSLGSIVLKGLRLNTAFKVSYNDIVDEAKTSVGDSIVLPLPVGTYTNFKVSLNNCSKTVASSYDLKDPLAAPLEEQAGISTYCQDQEINISDLTNRVKSLPDAQLKWYKTTDGVPSDVPETPSTGDVGAKSVWVTQTINHCESDKLKLGIEVSPSANLITSKIDPSTCGLPDGKIEISSLANNIEYNIGYKKEGQAQTVKLMSDQFGKVVVNNLAAGNYSDVEVNPISGTSCFKISIDTLKLLAPGAPTLAPTVMGAGTYCEGGAIPALEATANSGGTLQWFSDIGLTNSVGTGTTMEVSPTKGNTTFYIVEVASECKSPMATVTSNVIAAPTPKVLVGSGGPASCKGTGYSLKLDESETDVRYTVFKDGLATNVALSGTGLGLIFPDQSEAGLYTIVGETEVGSCQENMTGQLTITKSIKPQVFITSGTIEGCEGTPGQNSVINLSGSEENTMYSLDPSNSNAKPGTGGPLTFTIEAKAVNNGSYVIIAINNQTGCDTIMNGEGIVNLKPGVGDPILSGADQYCNQTPSKVMLSVGNATEQSWSIAPDNAGSVDNTGNVTWKTTYSGSAKITVLVKNSACTEEGKQAEFTTKVFTTPDVSKISGDSLVCRGNIETYQVTAQPDIKYNWSIDANTNVEQDDQNGTMTLTYLEDLGAEGATLRVTPESKSCGLGNPAMMKIRKDNGCDLFVPNILTPNTSDNFNVWSIEGFNNFPNLNIEVFNRWGDRVYTYTGNYSKAWDGTQNGKPLPTATYYYVIDKKDGSAKVTGSVTIVRD